VSKVIPVMFPDPSTLNTEDGVSIKSVNPPPAETNRSPSVTASFTSELSITIRASVAVEPAALRLSTTKAY
jgi:hypothetical protein